MPSQKLDVEIRRIVEPVNSGKAEYQEDPAVPGHLFLKEKVSQHRAYGREDRACYSTYGCTHIGYRKYVSRHADGTAYYRRQRDELAASGLKCFEERGQISPHAVVYPLEDRGTEVMKKGAHKRSKKYRLLRAYERAHSKSYAQNDRFCCPGYTCDYSCKHITKTSSMITIEQL